MRSFKYTVAGFVCFLLTISFNVGMGLLVYKMIEDDPMYIKIIAIIVLILLSSLICTIIDYIRRKVMIERPLKEIVSATKLMTKGNFKVRLIPHNTYENYDEFDYIKDNLNKMAEELSKSEILKTDFIANVSHEIKTPISVIQSYASALNNNNLDEETKKEYIKNMQEACRKLNNLITNVLKLNKLEHQKLTLEITKFNLSESLTKQILLYEDLIDKKEINLECDIEEDIHIRSEESYLEIIWNNLISNAIKFTESKGTVKVSLNKINEKYIIKISDTGCGMDKETGAHIFDKFYQGDTSHSKEGNGLGLALVKRVIDTLGGIIEVESELGVGTTFTVTIMEA